MRRLVSYLAFFIMSCCSVNVPFANAGPGSCANIKFPPKGEGKVILPYPVKVLRENVPVYADSKTLTANKLRLSFNTNVWIENEAETRVEVKRFGPQEDSIGWVNKTDLLCRTEPLISDSGLEKNLYIRTATEIRQNMPLTVRAYPSPPYFTVTKTFLEHVSQKTLPEDFFNALSDLEGEGFLSIDDLGERVLRTTGQSVWDEHRSLIEQFLHPEYDLSQCVKTNFRLTDDALNELLFKDLPKDVSSALENMGNTMYPTEEELREALITAVGNDPGQEVLFSITEAAVADDACQELSRFTRFYVFEENKDSYLLSDSYRFRPGDLLIGWVDKNNGFIWDSSYALRPKEDLKRPDGEEGTICVYGNLEDALAERNCQPVLGGERWFSLPQRIPILNRIDSWVLDGNMPSYQGFTLTDKAFEALKAEDIPEDVLTALRSLQDVKKDSQQEFLDAVAWQLQEKDFDTYSKRILKYARSGSPLAMMTKDDYDTFLNQFPHAQELLPPPIPATEEQLYIDFGLVSEEQQQELGKAYDELLKRSLAFYQVVLPLSGSGARIKRDQQNAIWLDETIVPDDVAKEQEQVLVEHMRQLDVLFLLDGTYSMGPYIDKIKGTSSQQGLISQIMKTLQNHEKLQGMKIKFGFRIYRDTYAGDMELGQGLAIPSECDDYSEEALRANRKAFQEAFQGVQESKTREESGAEASKEIYDYEENFYGGIRRASQDLRACRGKTQQVLFVIGDHGYNADTQQKRGKSPILQDELVQRLQGNGAEGSKNVLTFFLQTPSNCKNVSNSADCDKAYELFGRQSREILKRILHWYAVTDEILKTLREQEVSEEIVQKLVELKGITFATEQEFLSAVEKTLNTTDPELFSLLAQQAEYTELQNDIDSLYFQSIDAEDLNENLIEGLTSFINIFAINEIAIELSGGKALVDIIDSLKRDDDFNDLPGLFWELVKQGSCKELGDQCRQRIYDTILEGYVRVTDDVQEDVWLRGSDLERWIRLLEDLVQMENVGMQELRGKFVDILVESLEKVLGGPTYTETKESFAEFIQRKGKLPVRDTSPVFRYSKAELEDPTLVEDCEIFWLTAWVTAAKEMLSIVYQNLRPEYSEEGHFGLECPSADHVPFISDVRRTEFSDHADNTDTDDMSYRWRYKKIGDVYWVPKQYLP